MATTPKTVRTWTLNSSTRDFTIPFEYLARKFIVVTLIGATRRELVLNTDYRFVTATQVTTTRAWGTADGFDLIEIRRVTSASERLVDFADGSILRAYDLNISSVQSLHIAEEARDLTADTIGVNNDGNLDARARRIVNLADAIEDGDAVNLRQQKQWAGSALNQAQAAAVSAQLSDSYRSASVTAAGASQAARDLSLQYRNQAETFKNQAAQSQQSAATSDSNAMLWASQTENTVVYNGLYSSLHYSRKSAASATAASGSAGAASGSAAAASGSAATAKTEADRATTEANKLGNANQFMGTLRSVEGDPKRVIWNDGYQLSFNTLLADDLYGRSADALNIRAAAFHVRGGMTNWGNVSMGQLLDVLGKLSAKGGIDVTGLLKVIGSIEARDVINLYPTGSNSPNVHYWFRNFDGSERALLYAAQDNTLCIRVGGKTESIIIRGASGNVEFPAGREIQTQGGINNSTRCITTRNGVPTSASMYDNSHFTARTTDGTPPAYTFLREGSYALALWMNGYELNMMGSDGNNRSLVNNANFNSMLASNGSAGAIGTYAFCYSNAGSHNAPGNSMSGNNLVYSDVNKNNGGAVGGGTWRSMGYGTSTGVSLYLRVA